MIIMLTGQAGCGKTTLARELKEAGVVDFVIDGDDLRALSNPGYDTKGRIRNVERAHAIALYLHGLGARVAISLQQPFTSQRYELKRKVNALELYMRKHYGVRREYWFDGYEEPKHPHAIDPDVAEVKRLVLEHKKRPRATFIGRYQTFHDGHRWLFNQALQRGDPIQVLVRDTTEERDAYDIAKQIRDEYRHLGDMVRVEVVSNVLSVEYGRGVGYEIVEHEPPEEIKKISGTAIRAAREKGS